MDTTYHSKKFLKDEALPIISLVLLFLLLLPFFWGHLGNPVVDCATSPLIAQQILSHQIQFDNLFYYYGPFLLSYYINALGFLFLGDHLNTVYILGSISSIVIIVTIYLIARSVTTRFTSFMAGFLVTTCLVFQASATTNYIFPYTASTLYNTCSILLATLGTVYYVKTSRSFYIFFSAFFLSLSLLFRYEFVVFIALFIVIIILKPLSVKDYLKTLLYFSLCPLLFLIFLFIQGLSVSDIIDSFMMNIRYTQGKYIKLFYTYLIGFYFDRSILVVMYYLSTITIFLIFLINSILGITLKIIQLLNKNLHLVIHLILIGCLIFFAISLHFDQCRYFAWLPVANVLILAVLTISLSLNFFKENKIKFNRQYLNKFIHSFQTIDIKDKTFFVIIFAALATTFKGIFFILPCIYGSYLLPLCIVSLVVFFVDYIPKLFKFKTCEIWYKSTLLTVFLIGIMFINQLYNYSQTHKTHKISTEQGTIYADAYTAELFNKTIVYIKSNIKENESFLVLPETHLLNFLTRRSSPIFRCFHPLYIEFWGDNTLLKDLEDYPPDYILFSKMKETKTYKYELKDLGPKVKAFIEKEYSIKNTLTSASGSLIKVYKKKKSFNKHLLY